MAGTERKPITYASTGVDYSAMDPLKRLAQKRASETSANIERLGFHVVELSRGESAFVIDEGDRYSAHVIEGLGTKNLIAEMMKTHKEVAIGGEYRTNYDVVAQDTVAMIVNDLITVGAEPVVINAYWAAGHKDWFTKDLKRLEDLAEGWKRACDLAGAVWGGGETPTLRDIITPTTADFAGSAYGIIKPKERLTLGDKLKTGDAILLIESSGIHANGLTIARDVASKLPEGYATKLLNGKTYGESLLVATHIYAGFIRDLFFRELDVHYMVNITGHGWKKLMRADRELTYVVERVPEPHAVFKFIQEQSGNDDTEMYGNFNMGAGFAVFLPKSQAKYAKGVAINSGLRASITGHVEEGPRQVVIKPKNLTFKSETLAVR